MKKIIATLALLALAAPALANGEKTPAVEELAKSVEPAPESASSVTYEEGDAAHELLPGELVGSYAPPAGEGSAR